jgi:hypothetical protein
VTDVIGINLADWPTCRAEMFVRNGPDFFVPLYATPSSEEIYTNSLQKEFEDNDKSAN